MGLLGSADSPDDEKPAAPETFELESQRGDTFDAEDSHAPLLQQDERDDDSIAARPSVGKGDGPSRKGLTDGDYMDDALDERSRRKSLLTRTLIGTALIVSLVLGLLLLLFGAPSMFARWTIADTDPPHMQQAPNTRGNQKAFIAASYKAQPHKWMRQIGEDWDIYRYLSDVRDANPSHRQMPPSSDRQRGIPVVDGLGGREAMPYLTFITDQWDNLPPFMVFMHGHDMAWHQPEHAIAALRALNLSALEEQGWMSIRCSTHITCADTSPGLNMTTGPEVIRHGPHDGAFEATRALPAWWMWAFGEQENVHEAEDMPDSYNGQFGGQFAVTAEQVKKRPLKFYQRLLGTMISPTEELDSTLRQIYTDKWNVTSTDREHMFGTVNEYMIGILFEKSWHKIFQKPNRFCPDEETCREKWYSGAIHCKHINPPNIGFASYQEGNCTVNGTAMANAIKMNAEYIRQRNDTVKSDATWRMQ